MVTATWIAPASLGVRKLTAAALMPGAALAGPNGEHQQGKLKLSLHDALQPLGSSQTSTAPSEDSGSDQPKKHFQPYHAQSVPRPENLQAHAERGGTQVTSLMLRNIPNKYTQSTLLQEINEFGFTDTYDFFYLPMDIHNRSNVGYSFINFGSPADAERFRASFSDHRFQKFHSRKIGSVCTAHVQGLEENVRHFENRAVTQARNNQYRPIVLKSRRRMNFEDAVAEMKASDPASESLLDSGSAPPIAIADARQGLEDAIRQLLASSADPTPTSGPSPALTSPASIPEFLLSAGLQQRGAFAQCGAASDNNRGPLLPGEGETVAELMSLRNVLAEKLAEKCGDPYGRKNLANTRMRHDKARYGAPLRMDDPVYVRLPGSESLRLDAFDSSSSDEWNNDTPRTNAVILGACLDTALDPDPTWRTL